MKFKRNDGGRLKAGWKGKNAGDCVPRALAIGLKRDYGAVRKELDALTKEMTGGFSTTTNNGCSVPVYHRFLTEQGWQPVLVKKAYLKDVPQKGVYIAVLSGHITTVVDGVVHDAWDCRKSRRTQSGSPKMLGYYIAANTFSDAK